MSQNLGVVNETVFVENDIRFHFDSSRNKWLSDSFVVFFGRNGNPISNNAIIAHAGLQISTAHGIAFPRNATILSVAAQNGATATDNCVMEIVVDQTVVDTSLDFPVSASPAFLKTMNLNLDIDADSFLYGQIDTDGGGGMNDPSLVVELAWRSSGPS